MLWPVTVLNYPRNSILHLKCPDCQHSFTSDQLAVGKIDHVGVGYEDYPAAPVVKFRLVLHSQRDNQILIP